MSWAEVKHAINSTVGTSEFKPLDEIVRGNWNLIESENVYIAEKPSYSQSSGIYSLSNSFKMHTNGTVRLRLKAEFSAGYTFQIYKNGTLVDSLAKAGANNEIVFIVTVSVKTNDIFTFKLVRTSGSTGISSMNEIAVLCTPVYAPMLVESL